MRIKFLFVAICCTVVTAFARPLYEGDESNKQIALDSLSAVITTVESFITKEAGFSGGELIELQTNYANKPNFIWCNEAERNEGPIINLIDGDPKTYFYSCYSSTIEPVHWLQINLDSPLEKFDFSYHTRQNINENFPQAIEVMGSNDGTTFTSIKTFEGLPQTPDARWESGLVVASQQYTYLRFVVTAPRVFFHMAEFAIKTETVISEKYRPYLGYLNNLRQLCNEAKAVNNENENVEAEDIFALAEKLKAYYAIKDDVVNDSITDYGLLGNLVWKLKENEVTISGRGAMPEKSTVEYPWYKHYSSINRVVIGDDITNVAKKAFYSVNYENLVCITLGKSIRSIDEYALRNPNGGNLKVVSKSPIPPVITSYSFSNVCVVYVPEGSGALYRESDWGEKFIVEGEGVTINATLTEPGTLGDKILEQIENFKDVNNLLIKGAINSDDIYIIQNSLTSLVSIDMSGVPVKNLQSSMFSGRTRLQKVVLPNTLEYISGSMFNNCSMLEEVKIPSSVTSIESYAFNNCYSLRNIVLHEGITDIGTGVFEYCKSLKEVKIPSTLHTIGTYTFMDCHLLKNVEFSEGLTEIGEMAFSDCAIEKLKFPSTLRTIKSSAFSRNKSLKEIEFNEGLHRINNECFNYCDALTEVTLPSSLVFTVGALFYSCNNLKKITSLSVVPPYITQTLLHNDYIDGCELYVPAISLNVYKQTEYWDKFPTIKQIDYLPQNITVLGDYRLTLPDNLPLDYKPNVSLLMESSYNCGALTVKGSNTLNASSFNTIWDYYDGRYCSLINNAVVRADSVSVDIYVRNNRWVFITLPFDVRVSDIEPTSEGTTNFVVRRYDGELRAAGKVDSTWIRMAADDILKAGEGYILQASRYVGTNSQSASNLRFNAVKNAHKNKIFTNEDETIVLNEYQSEFMHHRSWNLIGNPYPCYYDTRFIDFSSPITVWDAGNNTYAAYSLIDDSYILLPGEAFFVQCPVNNKNIIFNKEGRQTDSNVRTMEFAAHAKATEMSAMRTVINITISDGTNCDKTRVVINDNAEMHYEMEKDASKFMSSNVAVPQIYTVNDGIGYSINERPLDAGKVKLNTIINADGVYTIALADIPDECTVCLLDNKTGAKVQLTEKEYSFYGTAGENPERFMLIVDLQGKTGIHDINADDNDNEDVYNLHGIKITRPLQKGIYIKKGKKIIVK